MSLTARQLAGLDPVPLPVEVPEVEGVYLIHLSRPLAHARHYIGWAGNLRQRTREHLEGHASSSPMLREALRRGIELSVSVVWLNRGRAWERHLKDQKSSCRLCPHCRRDRMDRENLSHRTRHRRRIARAAAELAQVAWLARHYEARGEGQEP